MIAFLKAIPLGIFLTLLVCLFIGSAGSSGAFLNIFKFDVIIREISVNFGLYSSWPMFLIGTVLSWAILYMMD